MTKRVFVETKKKFKDSNINLSLLDDLPGQTISLAATIQYIDLIPKVKKYLESKEKKVIIKKGAYYPGHALGCNSAPFDSSADTILFLVDGKFHAINNAIQLQREIFVFSGISLEKIEQAKIDQHNTKTKGKKMKFLASKNIGILISSKYGQKNPFPFKIKKAIEKLDKKAYVFESNNINIGEFENYKDIGIWVNTACYGLHRDDIRIINLSDIVEYLN